MKKLFTLLLAVLMLTTLSVTASANELTYAAPYGTPAIDGDKTDAVWENAPAALIPEVLNGTFGESYLKLAQDGENLYVLLWGKVGFAATEWNIDVTLKRADGSTQKVKTWQDGLDEANCTTTNAEVFRYRAADKETYVFEMKIPLSAAVMDAETFYVNVACYLKDGATVSDFNFGGTNVKWSKDVLLDTATAIAVTAVGGADASEDTTAPTEGGNTSADTTKPAETPTTDKVPTTADAGMAVATVVMAAAAMVVLKKKH